MPLDPQAGRFLRMLSAMNPVANDPVGAMERREALARLLEFGGTPEAVAQVENLRIAGPVGSLPIRIYTPAAMHGVDPLPGLVYFHGGGLVAGSLDTHDVIARALTNASGCRLVSIGYGLGPEQPFPAAIDDGCAAMRWVANHAATLGIDARRLGIGGDSAGATLAAVVCHTLVLNAERAPAFQFLLCPITDFAAQSDSRREFAQGYLVDEATLRHDLQFYLRAPVDPADPRLSPLHAPDMRGLPPTILHTAEYDPLRDEGLAYVERLRSAGVRTVHHCHAGMIHLFYGLRAVIPAAAEGYAVMGTDIRSVLAAIPTDAAVSAAGECR